MLKKILVVLALTVAACCFAAVDVNTGTEAELDGIKGIGPAMSGKILSERKKAPFKDWKDLMGRVKGIGSKSAARLSDAGLTVSGETYSSKPANHKEPKP